jgi:stage II sporulation protein AA (anti-sigma F factor antagonist)
MEQRFEQDTGRLLVRMPRELDHHHADQLKDETDYCLNIYPVRTIVFDFRDTEFMDSSGIGVIIGRCRNLNFSGGHVVAVHLNEQVQKIFRLSGLHKLVKVEK